MTPAAKRLYQGHYETRGDKFGNSITCLHCRWTKITNSADWFGAAVMLGHFVNHFRECHQALYRMEVRREIQFLGRAGGGNTNATDLI